MKGSVRRFLGYEKAVAPTIPKAHSIRPARMPSGPSGSADPKVNVTFDYLDGLPLRRPVSLTGPFIVMDTRFVVPVYDPEPEPDQEDEA
jgi:hypothetical protein